MKSTLCCVAIVAQAAGVWALAQSRPVTTQPASQSTMNPADAAGQEAIPLPPPLPSDAAGVLPSAATAASRSVNATPRSAMAATRPTEAADAGPPLPPPMPTGVPSTQPAPAVATQASGPLASAAQTQPAGTETEEGAQPTSTGDQLRDVDVTADVNRPGEQIIPSIGAASYTLGPSQIQAVPGGENATFQQVLLRAPGVVEDSFGQEHVRGEHGNLTYRVNGVFLPEGLEGFGQELDTRIIGAVSLIDGSLPAEFGFRTAGIVDVTTKSGATLNANQFSLYGGSYNTIQPSLQLGGTRGKLDYFVTASYKQNGIGIENPTPSADPQHDWLSQKNAFGYFSYHVDDTSRLTLMLNGSYADYQIPTIPGRPAAYTLAGINSANSGNVDENQNEQDDYSVLSYQKTEDKFSFVVAAYSRYGAIHFTPDPVNDLIFSGVAGGIRNTFFTNGLQFDGTYSLDDHHTLRAGLLGDYTAEMLNTNNLVFPVDASGAQTSTAPNQIVDKGGNWGARYGIYLQDEWKLTPSVTFNYGARYDRFDASFDREDQLSPRANLVWKIDDATTTHAGYSRFFAPPPVQYVLPGTAQRFAGTSNAPASPFDSPPKVERSNYYDIGISRQFTPAFSVTLDAFYKGARNLVDEGQFGNAIILSPYNYRKGIDYGGEVSGTYKQGGWSLFGNFAYVNATGQDINSSQYLFAQNELAFIASHAVPLDHESLYTASAGASYVWKDNRISADMLYGSGLRAGFANQQKEPHYIPVNLSFEHIFHPQWAGVHDIRFRFDIVNIFDEVYQLRNGTGIGVGAPQYGQRRSFFAGLSYDF